MQSVSWLGFVAQESNLDALVHFLPAARGMGVPYPADCKLTLFGGSKERKSIILEGARIGHPDGIRLRDAFSVLSSAEEGALFGFEVEISTKQPRVNILPSRSILELVWEELSTKFEPKLSIATSEESFEPALLIRDSFVMPSLVFINSSSTVYKPEFHYFPQDIRIQNTDKFDPDQAKVLAIDTIAPESAKEVKLDSVFASNAQTTTVSWGVLRSMSLFSKQNRPSGVAVFLVYRQVLNRVICSVQAL